MSSPLYVVTGAGGFIGSHIVERLLSEGCAVRGVDNFSTGKRENVAPFLSKMDFVEGDLADVQVAQKAAAGATYIIHQAAIPSVPRSVKDPISTNRSCVDATINVLMAARDAQVKRVMIAASSSAYGDAATLPKREDMGVNPLSPYAAAKLAQESYASAFSRCYGLETVCLRYFNVFGPRQDPKSDYAAVIPKFIRLMLNGEAPCIYGDGGQSRDFTYIANVVDANLRAARADGKLLGEVINIACGEAITLNDLVVKINGILGTSFEAKHAAPAAGDVRHSLADIAKAKRLLGYTPLVSLDEGLKQTAEHIRKTL